MNRQTQAWKAAIERNAVRPDGIGVDDFRKSVGIGARRWESLFNERGKAEPTAAEAKAIARGVENIGRVNAMFFGAIEQDRARSKIVKQIGEILSADARSKAGRSAIAQGLGNLGLPGSGPKAIYLRRRGGGGGGAKRIYPSGAWKRSHGKGGGRG